VLTLADGSNMEFPYNVGSNLPIMLSTCMVQMGLTFEDHQLLQEMGTSAYVTVADELNQNLTASQKELLTWHWRLGHATFDGSRSLQQTRGNLQTELKCQSLRQRRRVCLRDLLLCVQHARWPNRLDGIREFLSGCLFQRRKCCCNVASWNLAIWYLSISTYPLCLVVFLIRKEKKQNERSTMVEPCLSTMQPLTFTCDTKFP